jgi:membrane-bound serine protease (ClpP class)
MDTPGGRVDITLDMMEMLDKFEGDTITYVNEEAISAGAYISLATDAIYFSPEGRMGAAAVITGTGEDIGETMKAKIDSYMLARMRIYTEDHLYGAEVIRAMSDIDYEFKIGDELIKEEGTLLTLTAKEAVAEYGDPPQPLLAEGIFDSLDDLLTARYGIGGYQIESFELSWSEEFAKYMDAIKPLLMGIGLLLLIVEFKTPGFGIFGISGLVVMAIVFASNYVAGLAGFEAILFFILGLVLIVVDIFLLPGTFIFLAVGLLFMIGAMLWSLSDVWPAPDGGGPGGMSFVVDADSVWTALYQVVGSFAVAIIGLWLVWKFLPKTPIYGKLVHSSAGTMPTPVFSHGGMASGGKTALPDVGSKGVVVSAMHPLGEVKIDGVRYQASVGIGTLDKGTPVIVTGYKHFNLLVEKDTEKQQ